MTSHEIKPSSKKQKPGSLSMNVKPVQADSSPRATEEERVDGITTFLRKTTSLKRGRLTDEPLRSD